MAAGGRMAASDRVRAWYSRRRVSTTEMTAFLQVAKGCQGVDCSHPPFALFFQRWRAMGTMGYHKCIACKKG